MMLDKNPREGWAAQFRLMAQNQDDLLLDEDVSLSTWDETEWDWDGLDTLPSMPPSARS